MTIAARPRVGRIRASAGTLAFQVGRVLERKLGRLGLAESAYRTAHRLAPDRPTVLFRLGRVRERIKNWSGAERAYTSGIALAPPNVEAYLGRRAGVRERQGRWHEALADCQAAPGVQQPARLLPRLAAELRREGRVLEAVSALERVTASSPTRKVWAALAECYLELGDLGAACGAFRAAVDLKPDNLTIRTSLGRASGRRSLQPFEFIGGHLTPVATEVGDRALAEAVAELEHVVVASETRVWTAYWLGRILESHRRLTDALQAYDTAISRVQTVDLPWAHHAEQAWRFRRAYVERQVSREPSVDARINRTVTSGPPHGEVSDAAGYFEASVTNNGLLVEGFVMHGHEGSVDLCLDGAPVLSVAGNETAWNRDFKSTIVHNVVNEFPQKAQLTVRVGDASLVTLRGARWVEVVVPDGSGQLAAMLASGRTITKKGRWPAAIESSQSQDELYLGSYAKARQFFDEELGIKLFVSYGTLLGCYRDGRLIPGDDDFDVSFTAEATDPDSLKLKVSEIIRALLRGGFDSRVAVDGRMFHLRVDDVVLDVNPFWFFDGRAWSFDAHELGREAFDPVTAMTVRGVEVYIPGKTEAFLEENYGPDWRTPRSDFQYHRSKADQTTLRLARLVPSEVRELLDYSEQLLTADPPAGRFHGYGDPANPQFD